MNKFNAEPIYYSETFNLGNLEITFRGEQYGNNPIQDTEVKIKEGQLCWINWAEKNKMVAELNDLINKYRI